MSSNKISKLIEAEFHRGVRQERRQALFARLRDDPDGRRRWDRCAELFRALERREVSTVEIEQVERWLFEDLEPERGTAPARLRRALARLRWPAIGGLVVAAAAVALLVLPRGPEPGDDEVLDGWWAARGHQFARPLGIDAVCGVVAHSAADHGCVLEDQLGFGLRWPAPGADGGMLARGHLSLFGVDDEGELLYYAPTPIDPAVAVERRPASDERWDAWRSVGIFVNLAVNHEPGRVRLYALLSPRAPNVTAIETLALALREEPPADPGAPAWHRRLDDAELGGLCSDRRRCASAELTYNISLAKE